MTLYNCNSPPLCFDFSMKIRILISIQGNTSVAVEAERGGAVQTAFSDPSETDAARSQNLEQQNMYKEQTASLGFFQSTSVCGLQKPPHTSIFCKSFYETGYEAIKMICGPFLNLVY